MAFGFLLLSMMIGLLTAIIAFVSGQASLLTVFGIYVGSGLFMMVVAFTVAFFSADLDDDLPYDSEGSDEI